jgi:ferredoxin
MRNLEDRIKEIAREKGVALIGITGKERLLDAPPSANPEYLLPSARSVISMAMSLDKDTIQDFLGKKSWLTHGDDRKKVARALYMAGDRIAAFLQKHGHESLVVGINNNFRPEAGAADITEMTEFYPEFAHRYGAVAAGIGRLGWSGNVLHPEYGGLLELGTVITSADLEPDPLLAKNPCDRCKMCALVCPVGMISKTKKTQVTVAGITEEIAAKMPNTCCWIGCSGYHGLSADRKWSNWSPYRLGFDLPENKQQLDELNIRLQKADPVFQLENSSFSDYRGAVFNPDWNFGTVCGNCRIVCWNSRSEREANMRLLNCSGVVALSPNGEHLATSSELVEIETPFLVKVAVKKAEYEAACNGFLEIGQGYTPLDREVLQHVFRPASRQ